MQSKRVAMVTGANQGVGFQVAKELVANVSLCWSGRAISSAARPRPRRSDRAPSPFSST
jgi:NAD(P)-dependent dehydrogenase (short-subunit alcohol dehydrogenase family)